MRSQKIKYQPAFGQNIGLKNKLDATYKENTSRQTPRIIKIYRQKGSVARGDQWKDSWICETGMSQQVVQSIIAG